MESKRLTCPLCGDTREVLLAPHQNAHRCKACSKLVKAILESEIPQKVEEAPKKKRGRKKKQDNEQN